MTAPVNTIALGAAVRRIALRPRPVRQAPAPAAHSSPPLPRVPLWKRIADIASAGAVLVALLPLFALVAAFIKSVSPGPVFFRQERVGRGGGRFRCWKFRTMRPDADAGVHRQHVSRLIRGDAELTKLDQAADPRLIPFARVLRATGIDELPQLFNVLRGEMSLVGPRPCVPYEYEQFEPWHRRRCDVLPGLTGLWQVSGKNRTTFTEMMRLDGQYAQSVSPLLDLEIVLRTPLAVLTQVLDHIGGARVRSEHPVPSRRIAIRWVTAVAMGVLAAVEIGSFVR